MTRTKEASDDDPTKEKIDDAARAIVEGLGRMLKLFQDGVVPEKIPELILDINDKFLKSIGEPDEMKKLSTRFDRVSLIGYVQFNQINSFISLCLDTIKYTRRRTLTKTSTS